MLHAENVSFAYPGKEKTVLKDISVQFEEGCFTAVLGHNGSGKSTLSRIFNALLIPTQGKVTVDGLDSLEEENIWEIRKLVGMVFQNPDNQLVATTVEEDVAFGPENLGLPSAEIRQRVEEALGKVNMLEYRKHQPHQLSGGQKQRVAIAGILAIKPKYIFFDEATAMLDPQGRFEVMDTIHDLHSKGGITPIIITHFMEEAALAQRVIVMSQGEIVMDGAPTKIFTEIKRLQELKLDVPVAVEMSNLLRKEGILLPSNIITNDELVEELCHLK